MTYVLVVWVITHMHVFEMHPQSGHEGAAFFISLQECTEAGEMLTLMEHHYHRFIRYRCEIQV